MIFYAHPSSIIDQDVIIGNGTKVWHFSHICSGAKIGSNCTIGQGVYIGNNVKIGDNCKIQNNSLIYEGVTLENDVFFGPNTVTTNDYKPSVNGEWKNSERFKETLFKKGCSIGANSVIICGVIIGENSLIGAGSVVTKSTPAGSVYCGNPAILLKS